MRRPKEGKRSLWTWPKEKWTEADEDVTFSHVSNQCLSPNLTVFVKLRSQYFWLIFNCCVMYYTYQVEASHAASGLTILHIEEKEDMNGPQNEVEDFPPSRWTYYVSLLRHHPESRTKPVHTWQSHTSASLTFNTEYVHKHIYFRLNWSLADCKDNKDGPWENNIKCVWFTVYQT